MKIPDEIFPRMQWPHRFRIKLVDADTYAIPEAEQYFMPYDDVVIIRYSQMFVTTVKSLWHNFIEFTAPVPFPIDCMAYIIRLKDITPEMQASWETYADVHYIELNVPQVNPVMILTNLNETQSIGGDELNGTVPTEDVAVCNSVTDPAGCRRCNPDNSLAEA